MGVRITNWGTASAPPKHLFRRSELSCFPRVTVEDGVYHPPRGNMLGLFFGTTPAPISPYRNTWYITPLICNPCVMMFWAEKVISRGYIHLILWMIAQITNISIDIQRMIIRVTPLWDVYHLLSVHQFSPHTPYIYIYIYFEVYVYIYIPRDDISGANVDHLQVVFTVLDCVPWTLGIKSIQASQDLKK